MARIWESVKRCLCYKASRYTNWIYALLGFVLLALQHFGLEFIYEKFVSPHLKGPLQIHVYIRIIIYFIFLIFLNYLLFKNYIFFLLRQHKETSSAMNSFLKMTIEESYLKWFYIIKYILIILSAKSRFVIWVTPQKYMKMHTAAAILARRNYYSFYKALAKIWGVLRNFGGIEYRNEISNINLMHGERYVLEDKHDMSAYRDFCQIQKLELFYVNGLSTKDVADFSSFDVGDRFINLRIFDRDNSHVERVFGKFSVQGQPDEAVNKLNKIKFRVCVEISGQYICNDGKCVPEKDWVQGALGILRSSITTNA